MTAYQDAYTRIQTAKTTWFQYQERVSSTVIALLDTLQKQAGLKDNVVRLIAPTPKDSCRKVNVGDVPVLIDNEGLAHARVRVTFGGPGPNDDVHGEIDVVVRLGGEVAESTVAIVGDAGAGDAFPLQRGAEAWSAAAIKEAADRAVATILPKGLR